MLRTHSRSRSRTGGFSALETLLAVPIVLLLGLAALQWALVFHGRHAVAHAAIEAGRAGSVDHGSDEAILRGLIRGLTPWLYGASGPEDHLVNLARTRAHLALGAAAGWAAWERLAPTPSSFEDWGEPARDANGDEIAGLVEIPNDNLALREGARVPASGVSGTRNGEPVGTASGQTLADANLLKVEFVYGVPLTVPLIGRLSAWIMTNVDGCTATPASRRVLGTVDLGVPTSTAARAWTCAHYAAVDERGNPRPRWPVRASATIRMQSPARNAAASDTPPASTGPTTSLGLGRYDERPTDLAPPVDRVNPKATGPTEDGSADRSPGFLTFGADRLVPPPTTCL